MTKREVAEQALIKIGRKYITDYDNYTMLIIECQDTNTSGYVYKKENGKKVIKDIIADPNEPNVYGCYTEDHEWLSPILEDFVKNELESADIDEEYKEEIEENYIFRLNIKTGKLIETTKEEEEIGGYKVVW